MAYRLRSWATWTFFAAVLFIGLAAHAHEVTIDGDSVEWLVRPPMHDDVGIVARNSSGHGELIWRDRTGDAVSSPEVADLTRFHVTGNATTLFLFARVPNYTGAQQVQVQIALDLDQVPSSGASDFVSGAETKVSANAEWEFLVQTLFYQDDACRVLNQNNQYAGNAPCALGEDGIEIAVPWQTLGLSNPPSTPIRFSVAVFRGSIGNNTVEASETVASDALDALTNYGNPGFIPQNGTTAEVSDGQLDFYIDAWLEADGDVYAPVVVDRFNPSPSVPGSGEWVMLRNVAPFTLNLGSYKVGNEKAPDGTQGMAALTGLGSLAAGATFVIAASAAAYQEYFGVAPNAETTATSASVPNTTAYTTWATGSVTWANTGDELVVLDGNNTIVDVVAYDGGSYTGLSAITVGLNKAVYRKNPSADTDQTSDFAVSSQCSADGSCTVCNKCVSNACTPKSAGASCANGTVCDGQETCDGAGNCTSGTPLDCNDGNPCTYNACNSTTGCSFPPTSGVVCDDDNECTTSDTCDAQGVCSGSQISCPPYSECADANTSRAYTAGSCSAGECDYMSADTTCPAGCNGGTGLCNDDPCAGVVCSAPPSDCHVAQGYCDGGECIYELAQAGAPCDDGDACTYQDICRSGVCEGTSIACGSPPPAACEDNKLTFYADSGICVAGECQYEIGGVECALGCDPLELSCVADLCEGVVCNTPPSSCFAATGTCNRGLCTYDVTSGQTCDDADPCTTDDTCQADGACLGQAITCEDSLACGDTNTSVASTQGYCYLGRCNYNRVSETCSAGCDSDTGACVEDLCNGVLCNAPPSSCHQATGTCVDGLCAYSLVAAGTSCDDGDSCTSNDACDEAGACTGVGSCDDACAGVVCDQPPSACHASNGSCTDGVCVYEIIDASCDVDERPRSKGRTSGGCAASGGGIEAGLALGLLLIGTRRRRCA